MKDFLKNSIINFLMDPYHSFPCSYFFQGTETFYNCFHCTLYWFKQKLCLMMKNLFLFIYQQKKNYFPHSRQSEFFLGKSNFLQCWVGGRTPPPQWIYKYMKKSRQSECCSRDYYPRFLLPSLLLFETQVSRDRKQLCKIFNQEEKRKLI